MTASEVIKNLLTEDQLLVDALADVRAAVVSVERRKQELLSGPVDDGGAWELARNNAQRAMLDGKDEVLCVEHADLRDRVLAALPNLCGEGIGRFDAARREIEEGILAELRSLFPSIPEPALRSFWETHRSSNPTDRALGERQAPFKFIQTRLSKEADLSDPVATARELLALLKSTAEAEKARKAKHQ